MKKDSPIRLLPGYISFSFPVQIGLYPGNKQAECQGAKKYPIIPIGISDFSKSVYLLSAPDLSLQVPAPRCVCITLSFPQTVPAP